MSMLQEAMPRKEDEVPPDTEGFLHWLHRRWPHQCPKPGESLEDIHRYAGGRALIDAMMYRVFGPDKNDW